MAWASGRSSTTTRWRVRGGFIAGIVQHGHVALDRRKEGVERHLEPVGEQRERRNRRDALAALDRRDERARQRRAKRRLGEPSRSALAAQLAPDRDGECT